MGVILTAARLLPATYDGRHTRLALGVPQPIMRRSMLAVGLLLTTACTPLRHVQRDPAIGVAAADRAPAAAPAPVARGCPHQSDTWGIASAIRSVDAEVQSLLLDGCRESPTLQQLADAIGRTDGIVYVEIGPCPVRALRGCLLHRIKDTGSARYLWIRLTDTADAREFVATMAHELQHALEILARRDVRSQRDLIDFYQSLASGAYGSTTFVSPYRSYETDAALSVGAAVRAELGRTHVVIAADDERE